MRSIARSMSRLAILALFAAAALVPPVPARAAESLDTCTGIISSVPAVITTQGTWCLAGDLSTNATTGFAIEIRTNNVTLDCNHFKLGNLGAGKTTQMLGVYAGDRINVTVRRCVIRGFFTGVFLGNSGGGHRVEDNRIEGASTAAIYAVGALPSIVQRNVVLDIGGATMANPVRAVHVDGDVLDNVVEGVVHAGPDADSPVVGIYLNSSVLVGALVRGNRVRNVYGGPGVTNGIYVQVHGASVRENVVVNAVPVTGGLGVGCSNGAAAGNVVEGWPTAMSGCVDGGGNVAL